MKTNTLAELLYLRQILSTLSNISFNFSQINKRYPVDTLTELQASAIIETYKSYIDQVKKLVKEWK